MKKKYFIITIDTESDNQWESSHKQSTENARFIPRFQELCEKYGFFPTYLVDYSMGQDDFLIKYLKNRSCAGKCEVGMHLHAWDTPPYHEYDSCRSARPYLVEYPCEVMRSKIAQIHELLTTNFECEIVSHRAGRWVTNSQYFDILDEFGYQVDCSVTPGVSWTKSAGAVGGGCDYSQYKDEISWVGSHKTILEVPVTIKKLHSIISPKRGIDYIKEPIKFLVGRNCWLRPALSSNDIMYKILHDRKQNYTEFMMHSSEMMPGGSPYFKNQDDIEALYSNLEQLFSLIADEYTGITLKEFYRAYCGK